MSATNYSRQTLEETPARMLTFLRGVGTTPTIRAALSERGYTVQEHQQGWDLLHKVAGYVETKSTLNIDETQQAITAIDAWDEPTFRIAKAALERLHPDQAVFVFTNLHAAVGTAAVLTVRLFLERLDALENSPDRITTRAQDLEALATLEKRGITKEERQRMQTLLNIAQGLTPTAASAPDTRLDDLRALRAWFDDWSETARTLVTRRDYLIRLGLAKRKKSVKPAKPEIPATTTP